MACEEGVVGPKCASGKFLEDHGGRVFEQFSQAQTASWKKPFGGGGATSGSDFYTYVGNDPTNKTDPTGLRIYAPDERDRAALARMINSRAQGKYGFDKKGNLVKLSPIGKHTQRSSYYSSKLDGLIASNRTTFVDIRSTVLDPDTGKLESVDGKFGGGVTVGSPYGGDQSIAVSGREHSPPMTDTAGHKLPSMPSDILMHEIVSHAAPHILGPDTGSAVGNENKARQELPGNHQRPMNNEPE
jgi:hypothetical protein